MSPLEHGLLIGAGCAWLSVGVVAFFTSQPNGSKPKAAKKTSEDMKQLAQATNLRFWRTEAEGKILKLKETEGVLEVVCGQRDEALADAKTWKARAAQSRSELSKIREFVESVRGDVEPDFNAIAERLADERDEHLGPQASMESDE